jgi:hypothetical protein
LATDGKIWIVQIRIGEKWWMLAEEFATPEEALGQARVDIFALKERMSHPLDDSKIQGHA